jgi:hypothetical protein
LSNTTSSSQEEAALDLVKEIAAVSKDCEHSDDIGDIMENDTAFDLVHEWISRARGILGID